jgi:hypothetical protein
MTPPGLLAMIAVDSQNIVDFQRIRLKDDHDREIEHPGASARRRRDAQAH